MKRAFLVVLGILLLTVGCATVKPMDRTETLEQYSVIADLQNRLTEAKGNEVDVLAPSGFQRANELFEEALASGQRRNEEEAKTYATQGLSALQQARIDAGRTREIMWEVLESRSKAVKAGAPMVSKKEFEDTEKEFRKANQLVERNETDAAKKSRPELLRAYGNLKVKALKEGAVNVARAAFQEAKQQDVEEYAPKTFRKAEEEIRLTNEILDQDPSRVSEANAHAATAGRLSKEAVQIAELARTFDQRDFTHEDIILWYQQQLAEINQPLGSELDFGQPNRMVVGSLRDNISSLLQSKEMSYEEQKRKIDELKTTMDAQARQQAEREKQQAEKDRQEAEIRQRFAYVQSLFTPEEADVFRKGDDVLISMSGFSFPVGTATIVPENFGMLNKLINAIRQFPNSRIEVSGHTDSTGAADKNKQLSQERADNVAKFLVEVGNISQDRIRSEGFGSEKPVASNESAEGRAKNRRVEILIVNNSR